MISDYACTRVHLYTITIGRDGKIMNVSIFVIYCCLHGMSLVRSSSLLTCIYRWVTVKPYSS